MELNNNLKDNKNENFRLPRWTEIPNIDLYIDQVVSYLENYWAVSREFRCWRNPRYFLL